MLLVTSLKVRLRVACPDANAGGARVLRYSDKGGQTRGFGSPTCHLAVLGSAVHLVAVRSVLGARGGNAVHSVRRTCSPVRVFFFWVMKKKLDRDCQKSWQVGLPKPGTATPYLAPPSHTKFGAARANRESSPKIRPRGFYFRGSPNH